MMNLNERKKAAELMQAWADGKQMQWLNVGEEWLDCNNRFPVFNPFDGGPGRYRVKPEVKLEPWTPDDVPVTCWIREKGIADGRSLVCGVGPAGVWLLCHSGAIVVPFSELLEHHEHSIDGKTWLPCAKPNS